MGKNQLRLLKFAMRYPNGWHSCGQDSRRTMRSLEAMGLLEVIEYPKAQPQFRINIARDEEHT